MNRRPGFATAVAAYLPHQWSRWLASAEDVDTWEEKWEEWHQILEDAKINLARQGIRAVEVPIDLDEFEKYCQERGLKNVSSERAAYAATLFSQQQKRA